MSGWAIHGRGEGVRRGLFAVCFNALQACGGRRLARSQDPVALRARPRRRGARGARAGRGASPPGAPTRARRACDSCDRYPVEVHWGDRSPRGTEWNCGSDTARAIHASATCRSDVFGARSGEGCQIPGSSSPAASIPCQPRAQRVLNSHNARRLCGGSALTLSLLVPSGIAVNGGFHR